MNRLGKVSSRLYLSQSYQTTPINTAGITQGANTAKHDTGGFIAGPSANTTTSNTIADASAHRATNNVITASANLATGARTRRGSS